MFLLALHATKVRTDRPRVSRVPVNGGCLPVIGAAQPGVQACWRLCVSTPRRAPKGAGRRARYAKRILDLSLLLNLR